MVLSFCPDCKDLLIPEVVKGKLTVRCGKCGFSKEVSEDLVTTEKPEHVEIGSGVLEDKNIYATYDHQCEKCGYDKAEVIDLGVLISDEDNLIFIKCGKCKHVERIGRKTS